MAKVEIKGEQHTIGEVFSERFAFSVPPYQRPYAWTTEHAGELLDDLLGYLGTSDDAVEDLSPYFLGSIVLIKSERPDAQIVDGQQRLITLTILLATLRALIPPSFTEGITRRLYAPADPLNNLPARYRLRPKDRDALFFQEYIQSEHGIVHLRAALLRNLNDSQRNMRENTLYYLRTLGDLPEAQRIRLTQFIVTRCLLVVVSTPDLSSAYRIFSVLNDRGLDLSYADILKAEIIGQIAEHEQREYTSRWEDTEEALGRGAFDQLLTHIRMIYRKNKPMGTILDEFRAYVVATINDSRRLIDDVLRPYGDAFYVLSNARYESAEQPEVAGRINALLRWLNRLDNIDWIPPAMVYLRSYPDAPDRLERFFIGLERLAASLTIRRQFINKRIQRYNRLLAAIECGADLSLASSPMQLNAEEREATLGALSGDLYLMAAMPRQYALLRLDSSLAQADSTLYAHRTLTVEHVLPRNPPPESEWMTVFPTLEERARWVHRLGNLVLLSRAKNMQASNYDFARKKTIYFSSRNGVAAFALTTQVLQEQEWTPQVVERRQEALINHLKQLWRL
ncbi:MAG: DUF262 domain-containing HNH endonuclease family protein [Ktedonobacterales bacterium]